MCFLSVEGYFISLQRFTVNNNTAELNWLAAVPAVGLGTVNQLFIAIPICSNFVLVEKYSCI